MTEKRRSESAHEPGRGERIVVPGEEARQGRIVLNTRRRQAVFLGGLAAFVVLAGIGAAVFAGVG